LNDFVVKKTCSAVPFDDHVVYHQKCELPEMMN